LWKVTVIGITSLPVYTILLFLTAPLAVSDPKIRYE